MSRRDTSSEMFRKFCSGTREKTREHGWKPLSQLNGEGATTWQEMANKAKTENLEEYLMVALTGFATQLK